MDYCFSDPEEMADFLPPLPVQKPVGGPPTPAKPSRKVRPYTAASAGLSQQATAVQHAPKQWPIKIKYFLKMFAELTRSVTRLFNLQICDIWK